MPIIDYALLAILAYFFFWGFSRGLIRAVGSFIGLIAAVVISSRYFEDAAARLAPYVGLEGSPNVAKVIAFIVLLILVNRAAMLIVSIVARAYNTMAVVPGMKLGNRLLGAALGLIEGAIMIGLIIYVTSRFPFGTFVESFLVDSRVAPIVLAVSGILQPLLPEAIRQIKGLI
ncbi:MAG: CvpA family protein [Candidatus Komeilibacteria bacterium]|nr:CvpA family protein [Candidatus Komeilibacteria bacterium]